MDIRNEFWNLIERGARDPDRFQRVLHQLDRDALIAFRSEFLERAGDLITEEFELALEGYSEDGIEEIAEWVVSQGKSYYENVVTDPEKRLPMACFELDDSFTESSCAGIVENVFYERYGESIADATD